MNGNIYQVRPLYATSFLQKLLKQRPEENAVVELNNLLATKPILHISQQEVGDIEERYKLSLKREFALNLEEFYAVYLNYCLEDSVLQENELRELGHLKKIMSLEERSIEKLHTKIGEVIYKKSFEEAVSDGRLTDEEVGFLNKLKHTLRLPDALADKISTEIRTVYVQNYVAKVIDDQNLSPAEEADLHAIAANLNVEIQYSELSKKKLERLKLYWAIENLALPVVDTDITIQKSEVCYFVLPRVKWHEWRNHNSKPTYLKIPVSFKSIKNFYFNKAAAGSMRYSADAMKLIDEGVLCLTNKRIILAGAKKNANIRIDKIVDFTPYAGGVEIKKETGKNAVLQLGEHADVFCMMLERMLVETI